MAACLARRLLESHNQVLPNDRTETDGGCNAPAADLSVLGNTAGEFK
jgi:hypothetical protein